MPKELRLCGFEIKFFRASHNGTNRLCYARTLVGRGVLIGIQNRQRALIYRNGFEAVRARCSSNQKGALQAAVQQFNHGAIELFTIRQNEILLVFEDSVEFTKVSAGQSAHQLFGE